MSAVLVVVPVLGRPHRVEPLLASLRAAERAVPTRPLFVLSPGDRDERGAVVASGADYLVADWLPGRGDWARKINLAYRETDEPWIFTGADDLAFHAEWADIALSCGDEAARDPAGVVGTNDLGNPAVIRGTHATHSLVRRAYVDEYGTIDEAGKLLHDEYDHQFADNELVGTAISRGAFVFCRTAVVEHLHPHWRKGTNDRTYEKGQREFVADRLLFQTRSRLWAPVARRA